MQIEVNSILPNFNNQGMRKVDGHPKTLCLKRCLVLETKTIAICREYYEVCCYLHKVL